MNTANQGRNEWGQGGHNSLGANLLWEHWITAGAPNFCGSCRKVPTMSQVLSSIQQICYRKTSGSIIGAPNFDHGGTKLRPWGCRFDHGGTKLVFCPGCHVTSLRPCCQRFVDSAVNFIRAKTRVTSHLPTKHWREWCLSGINTCRVESLDLMNLRWGRNWGNKEISVKRNHREN